MEAISARTSRRRGVAVEEDSFEDLYLEDFIGANRRVARHLVQDMNITDRQEEFLNRGLQAGLDVEEDQHLVLELAVGYAATGTVMAIEEVALTNQRLMSLEERIADQERAAGAGGVRYPEGEGWGVGDYRLVPIGELTRSPASSEGRGVVVSDAGSDESMEV
jgi:hypothetical protein